MDSGAIERPTSKRQPNYVFSDVLIPMSTALDLAEGREPGHAQRVAFISMAIANPREMEAHEKLACVYGALMHDVGVIVSGAGLSEYTRGDERLVFAPMPLLTPDEAAAGTDSPEEVAARILDHVIHGSRVVQELGLPAAAVQGVTSHHERWDGSGYPRGLKGAEIPFAARVFSVVDCWDALSSDRPYRKAWPPERVNAQLRQDAGTILDPQIVELFLEIGGVG